MTLRLLCLLLSVLATGTSTAGEIDKLLVTCSGCHGADGAGNPALFAPPLAGQRSDYLARQLRNFKAGIRGYHREDRNGSTMRAIAATIKEEEIAALSAHFAALTPATLNAPSKGMPQPASHGTWAPAPNATGSAPKVTRNCSHPIWRCSTRAI